MTKRASVKTIPFALAGLLLAAASTPAWADGEPAGQIGADYANLSPSSGSNGDIWGIGGGLKLGLSPNWSLEGSLSYHKVSGGGSDVDSTDLSLTGLYKVGNWKLGPTLGYEKNSSGGFDGEVKSWGAVVDYSLPPSAGSWGWRLHAQGGGYDTNYGTDGTYWGAGVNLYPCPKLSIRGDVNYTRFNTGFGSGHETDYGLGAELQLGDSPFAISGGYTRNDFSPGSFHVDTWSLGVTYRFGADKASLQERHDEGLLPYTPGISAVGFKF